MIRIGILGCENSHADGFFSVLSENPAYADMKIVMLHSIYPEALAALSEKTGVKDFASRPEDMIGKVDAVMITARDGKYHAAYARPLIEAGIPCFVDKPFTVDPEEGRALIALAKEKKVPLIGGSGLKNCPDAIALAEKVAQRVKDGEKLRGGYVAAPVSLVNDYGNFYFYSAHLVELMFRVFGSHVREVRAEQLGDRVLVTFYYPDETGDLASGFAVQAGYYSDNYEYFVRATVGKHNECAPVTLDAMYEGEMAEFSAMVREGKMPGSYEDLLLPVLTLNAIEKSYKSGTRVAVEKP